MGIPEEKEEPPDEGLLPHPPSRVSFESAWVEEHLPMTLEHKMWLLDMVDELQLHARMAKIKADTAEQEWRILDHLISDELLYREAKAIAELEKETQTVPAQAPTEPSEPRAHTPAEPSEPSEP